MTATNDAGRVAHGFAVSVKTASQVRLTLVGDSPQLLVPVGQVISVDLSTYFSEAATDFAVSYDSTPTNQLVDVTMQGSVASIRGVRTGTATITLIASNTGARITCQATVQVTG